MPLKRRKHRSLTLSWKNFPEVLPELLSLLIRSKWKKQKGKVLRQLRNVLPTPKQLDKKTVRIRGKVMKFSSMIMGKNWIHLQDGTGDPVKKDPLPCGDHIRKG